MLSMVGLGAYPVVSIRVFAQPWMVETSLSPSTCPRHDCRAQDLPMRQPVPCLGSQVDVSQPEHGQARQAMYHGYCI